MALTLRKAGLLVFVILTMLLVAAGLAGAQTARDEVYSVNELTFRGPLQGPKDSPARDIDFWVRFVHESGKREHKVHGFWDGDGEGDATGGVFKVRFCPTLPGTWTLKEVHSSTKELQGQRQGEFLMVAASRQHGFWLPDPDSPGRRWYRRSNGSHQYIIGNTHYSFLSGYRDGGKPGGNDILADIVANAKYFKKLRFGLSGDYYPHPEVKPYLDDDGRPTDNGNYSHRPNPRWWNQRVDLAVRNAFAHDLIADLILAGPDTEEARSTLRPAGNKGDPIPFLKYIAARYGSYPNVWVCLCNEYDIRKPRFTEEEIARLGQTMRGLLPYDTPLSVHATPKVLWSSQFDVLPPWNDHQIIQKKIRTLAPSADVLQAVWTNDEGKGPRNRPTVNDELSYQGAGDKHSELDTIEAHLGAFLGGGYGTTGYKSGDKTGHYFWGKFDPTEHTAADNLLWLREAIDAHVTFWKMMPGLEVFTGTDPDFRAMSWPGREYVLGTNKAHKGLVVKLDEGEWTVTRYDILAKEATTLTRHASVRFTFDAPPSRAVLFHFRKNGD